MQWELRLLKHLIKKKLPYLNNNPLYLLGEKYALERFGEINRQVLKKCYFDDVILCRKVIHQLAFYGVIFRGGLYNYSILQHENDSLYLWKETDEEQFFRPAIPPHVLQQAKEYGVFYEHDAIGLPLVSFLRCQEDFPFEHAFYDSGFRFLTYGQLLVRTGCCADGNGNIRDKNSGHGEQAEGLAVLADSTTADKLRPGGSDIWGQVLDDLEALIKKPGGEDSRTTAEICEMLGLLREKIENSQKSRAMEAVRDTAGKIRLDGKILAMPATLQDREIAAADFPTCRQIPAKLRKAGFATWGDLPFELDGLLRDIPGVGPKTIQKFIAIVNEFVAAAFRAQTEAASLKIALGDYRVAVPDASRDARLTVLAEQCFSVAPVVEVLAQMGVSTFNDLPADLASLEANVPPAQLFELFDSLCQMFAPDLTLKARIQSVIAAILDFARERNGKGIRRVLDIVEAKFRAADEINSPTLQEIAGALGVTRERVRQIFAQFWQKKLSQNHISLQRIADDINRLGGLIPLRHFIPDFDRLTQYEQFIIIEAIRSFGLTMIKAGFFWTTLIKRDYEAVFNELEAALQDGGECVFHPAAVERTVAAFVKRRGFHFSCQKALVRRVFTDMLETGENGYVLKRLSKSEKILCVLKEYPQGLAVHKDADRFFARLDTLFPAEFKKNDRYIYSSIVNSPKALLWGWGIYIHRDNIRIKRDDLRAVVDWINRQFAAGIEKLSVNAAFHEFEAFMGEKGIPSEHALYSCLRRFYSQAFFMPKSPYLYPVHSKEVKQNTEVLEAFIRNRGENVSYTQLQAEFVGRRGWKEYALNQAIVLSRQVIRTGRGEYGLGELYPLASRETLEPLARFLETCLAKAAGPLTIRLVFTRKRELCRQLMIGNDIALYALMEKFFAGRFVFPQYPHVQAGYEETDAAITNVKQLDDYMRDFQRSVFRSEMKKEFVERRYWTAKALENALRANPEIFVLQYGREAEYVHACVAGWSERKQEQLETQIQTGLEPFASGMTPYGNVRRDLLKPQSLPPLAAGISWTVDLLKDRLKDCPFIKFIGTTKAIFVPVPNRYGICDDIDFLAFILQTEFQGTAEISQFQRRLAELNFSHHGEIPRSYRLADEYLPFAFTASHIMLKEPRPVRESLPSPPDLSDD
jgi:hypothetical protein